MVAPVLHTIVQGETLEFELRYVGEDLTNATPRAVTSAGMTAGDFTLTKPETDTVRVVVAAADTANFSTGTHDLQVWLDWSDGTKEVLEALVHVKPAL